MKCRYYRGEHGPCNEEELLAGVPDFVIAVLADGKPVEGTWAAVCTAHLDTYHLEVMEQMHRSLQMKLSVLQAIDAVEGRI